MALNKVKLNDISMFSDDNEVCLALVGKYAKDYQTNYQLSIIKNVCFINTIDDCKIEIPNHYAFKFTDSAGTHVIDESTNTLTIRGMTSLFFHIKNT
jgi:hypothetical protein